MRHGFKSERLVAIETAAAAKEPRASPSVATTSAGSYCGVIDPGFYAGAALLTEVFTGYESRAAPSAAIKWCCDRFGFVNQRVATLLAEFKLL